MSITRMGENNNFFGKKHSKENILKLSEYAKTRLNHPRKGISVEIIDTINNTTKVYVSIREAARDLGTNMLTLLSRERRGTKRLYRDRYNIIIKRT